MKTEKTVDRGSKEKLYVQIYSIFLEKIASGEWPAGSQIPPEDELCRIYDVSKVTVREAIQELVREGYFRRLQGKGTFVTISEKHPGILMKTRLTEYICGEEVNAGKAILEKGFSAVNDEVRNKLLTEDDVYHIFSVRHVNGNAWKEEVFIPVYTIPDMENQDFSGVSLYDMIDEKGVKKIFRIVQTIEVTSVDEETSEVLNAKKGEPALRVSRILISSDGTPVALTNSIVAGGTCSLQMEFDRIK